MSRHLILTWSQTVGHRLRLTVTQSVVMFILSIVQIFRVDNLIWSWTVIERLLKRLTDLKTTHTTVLTHLIQTSVTLVLTIRTCESVASMQTMTTSMSCSLKDTRLRRKTTDTNLLPTKNTISIIGEIVQQDTTSIVSVRIEPRMILGQSLKQHSTQSCSSLTD